MKRSLLVAFTLLCFSLLAACSPQVEATAEAPVEAEVEKTERPSAPIVENPNVIDESFITGEPCEAPCWYNIELGKTPEQEATAQLSLLPFVTRASIQTLPDFYDPQAKSITYDCNYETTENCGIVGISAAGVVSGIAHQIVYPLSVADVVEKYAEPAYMYTNAYYGEDDDCQLALYWPEESIAVEVVTHAEVGLCQSLDAGEAVPADLQVLWVYYSALDSVGGEGTLPWPGFAE